MVLSETYQGYRITVGSAGLNAELGIITRYCVVRSLENDVLLSRQEVPARLPIDAVLEAARDCVREHLGIEQAVEASR